MVQLDNLQCCEREREREKETEDMAAPECEREARKRRERRDSGCAHERKERRPHSEERPQAPLPPPPLQDYNRLESERRAERLSRARRPQFGVKRRRPLVRTQKPPKENDQSTTIEEVRCSTPPHFEYVVVQKPQISDEPQTLDAAALHRQIDRPESAEPTSGAEDSIGLEYTAAERVRRDERHAAPHNALRREQPSPDRRLEKLSKKIHSLKKNIGKHEAEFEAQNGHAITPSERITDVQLTQMYETLRRLQAEKRCIKADPVEYSLKLQAAKQQKERDEKLEMALKSEKSMVDIVRSIEEWLEGCRQAGGRASIPESNWNSAQLAAEKACVQKALLRMEAARGRPPAHSVERGAARHLYERYRTVKRVLASTRPDAIMGNGELATIHEHEAMLFNSVDSSSDSQEKPTESSQDTIETPLQSPPTRDIPSAITEEIPSSTSSAKSAASEEAATSNEALHCLGLEDLSKALIEAKVLKCGLRRSIKDYENSFEMLNSRKVQRDDKKGREDDYIKYKAVKARIKLITALINKQKTL